MTVKPVARLLSAFGLLFSVTLAATTSSAAEPDWSIHNESSTIKVDHSKWSEILGRYIVEGEDGLNRFGYGTVSTADKQLLDSYIADLSTTDVQSLNRDEQFAYWVNLYNAVTIQLILDNYPVDSIRDIKPSLLSIGPWGMKLVNVAGEDLTLDNIEHDILRGLWRDPRIHYAVNCASIGCPNLMNTAYDSNSLEEALDANARAYINHPRGARVADDKLVVSTIYKWFREDFGDSQQGVIEHLSQYAEPRLAEQLRGRTKINGHDYDWALNDVMPVMN